MGQRVAILGCGPAGLLAAHAATLLKCEVTIFSHRVKSDMRGAQYMHKPIPGLNLDNPVKLSYVMQGGTVDEYRRKVYGDASEDLLVSPEQFSGYQEAWSIRQAYNQLWTKYNRLIVDRNIDTHFLMASMSYFDKILSTIPATQLCYQPLEHVFTKAKVWIDEQWRGGLAWKNLERYGTHHVVLCNGRPFDSNEPHATGWYRTSIIYGRANTEWIASSIQFFASYGARPVVKPLSTNCTCWPNIIRAGRYGVWRKGVLSHEAFETALEVFA
jgi:hypothetical protein